MPARKIKMPKNKKGNQILFLDLSKFVSDSLFDEQILFSKNWVKKPEITKINNNIGRQIHFVSKIYFLFHR